MNGIKTHKDLAPLTRHAVVCIVGLGYIGLALAEAFSKISARIPLPRRERSGEGNRLRYQQRESKPASKRASISNQSFVRATN